MTLLNLNTSALETMQTKDALIFSNSILSKFSKAKNIFTNVWLERFCRVFDKMTIIEMIIQVEDENKEMKYYHLSLNRAKDFSCINAVMFKELNYADFKEELFFFKKFNEYTR